MKFYCSTKTFCIGLAVLGVGALYGNFKTSRDIYSSAPKASAPVKLLEGKIDSNDSLDLVVRLENKHDEIMLNCEGKYVNARNEMTDQLKKAEEEYNANINNKQKAHQKSVTEKTREYNSKKAGIEKKYSDIERELR
ncbi:Uncharacterised protein [uncultured archaeon]|nr:Uncharacterised protein [uncultured archaeon]